MMKLLRLAVLCTVFGTSVASVPGQMFTNTTAATGITVPPVSQWGGHGRGHAWADFDGDGDMDLFAPGGPGNPIQVWWNSGGTFVPQTVLPYLTDRHDHGCVAADFDNDGDQDVYLCQGDFKPNMLFVNDGAGNFAEMASAVGVAHTGDSYGASFGDYDRDGWLDLYLGNLMLPSGPLSFVDHVLYRNNGDGTFTDVTTASGTAAPSAALAVLFYDYNQDGWPDIHCCNDRGNQGAPPNAVLRNNGDGTFTDVSQSISANAPIGCMGVTIGDMHGDDEWDVFLTNTQAGHVLLQWNSALGAYDFLANSWFQVATNYGLQTNQIGWGCQYLDYDCDGQLDLYIMHELGTNRLFRGTTQLPWIDDTFVRGIDQVTPPGHSCAIVDYDDDGALDVWVPSDVTFSQMARNPGPLGNWIRLRLEGTVSNRDAIGAVVKATSASGQQRRMVTSGEGYLSTSDRRVHFGLGTDALVNTIEIRWPSGTVQYMHNLTVNQELVVVEPSFKPQTPLVAGAVTAFVSEFAHDVGLPHFVPLVFDVASEYVLADGRAIRVNINDPLIYLSTAPGNYFWAGHTGIVPTGGQVTSSLTLPPLPLTGFPFSMIGVTVDAAYPSGIKSILGPQTHVIQ